jgi:P27 family predicted phage terminase small subunit
MSVDAMARRAQPAILKELAGNPGKRPIKPELPAKGDPVPPKSLSKAAQAVWKRAVGSMPPGVYTTADEPALEAYADAVVTYRRLSAELESAPITIPGSTRQMIVNPIFKAVDAQARLVSALGSRLHLDPVARQGVAAPEVEADNPFAGLIQ